MLLIHYMSGHSVKTLSPERKMRSCITSNKFNRDIPAAPKLRELEAVLARPNSMLLPPCSLLLPSAPPAPRTEVVFGSGILRSFCCGSKPAYTADMIGKDRAILSGNIRIYNQTGEIKAI
ncbi:hypothetical protein T310_1124 [Rasamsonia emersonii CBS 393.64]|uniref:Uncharacterized protein n=1 Tax=Rasamsonia emersonii (strain ATCC 16479 / CBS 393.64 / IMI 116815) TaxID=1408163 RepID=A0A0F4Z441_RASE3|nr:hypothetical protein T310_1124 [Rasamsonia emersonii CBS 393.64]KKA24856.1 hypothetical protein T310_1124 [Rasamsonia emersonii CBS 393.64]